MGKIMQNEIEYTLLPMPEQSTLRDFFYPVGCYFETSNASFDPNVTWGGTWVLETAGQVHVSAGTGYTIGATGGEATHTLTVDEIPSHNHKTLSEDYKIMTTTYSPTAGTSSAMFYGTGNTVTGNKGGSKAHNNMQPYIVVNRWHRTA